MLSLTRKPQQSIRIGDDITITVQGVVGEKVRIAVEAPRDMRIYRNEIYDEILAGVEPDAKP